MFTVGDVIQCKESYNGYSLLTPQALCKVVGFYDKRKGWVSVKVIEVLPEHLYFSWAKKVIKTGEVFPVNPSNFNLVRYTNQEVFSL